MVWKRGKGSPGTAKTFTILTALKQEKLTFQTTELSGPLSALSTPLQVLLECLLSDLFSYGGSDNFIRTSGGCAARAQGQPNKSHRADCKKKRRNTEPSPTSAGTRKITREMPLDGMKRRGRPFQDAKRMRPLSNSISDCQTERLKKAKVIPRRFEPPPSLLPPDLPPRRQ